MKRILMLGLALCIIGLALGPTASWAGLANVTYVETLLSPGNYKYDFTFYNTSSSGSGETLLDMQLSFSAPPPIVSAAVPSGSHWTFDEPLDSSFVHFYSEFYNPLYAIQPESSLGLFSVVFNGELTSSPTFSAYFSSEQTSAVPIPSTLWLLGSGVMGFLFIRRKFIN